MDRLIQMAPEAVVAILDCADYVHHYEGHGDGHQELSGQMRELIATVLLAAKGEDRFAANHVRRLYRFGVTNAVIIEAFLAAVPIVGSSNMLHAMRAIHMASEPGKVEGALPQNAGSKALDDMPGLHAGITEPKVLADFPELHLGHDRPDAQRADTGLRSSPEWQYIAQIDSTLAERAVQLYNLVYCDGGVERPANHLPPAARELIAITTLCVRGLVDLAAQHMRRATRYGVSPRQILEAISSAVPMTGITTVQIGAQAMIKAGIALKT